MSTNSKPSSARFNVLSTRTIVPLDKHYGSIGVGPSLLYGMHTMPQTALYSADATIAPADLLKGIIGSSKAGAKLTLTMPSMANILTAFAAAGIVLQYNDTFTFRLEPLTSGQSIDLVESNTVPFAGAVPATLTITLRQSAEIRVRYYSNGGVPAMEMYCIHGAST